MCFQSSFQAQPSVSLALLLLLLRFTRVPHVILVFFLEESPEMGVYATY